VTPSARLLTFGGLSVRRVDEPSTEVPLQRRPLIALAIIAASGTNGLTRDKLVALLWPDADQARHALDQALTSVRRALGPEIVRATATGLAYNATLVPADVVDFDDAAAAGDAEATVACYTGPFLDGVGVSGATEFDRWVDAQRLRRQRQASAALDKLAQTSEALGEWDAAVALWERRLAFDPISAQGTVGLMRALATRGDRARALEVSRVYESLVRQELDIAPDPSVTALVDELRTVPPRTAAPTAGAVAPPSLPTGTVPLSPPAHGRPGHWGLVVAAVALVAAAGVMSIIRSGGTDPIRLAPPSSPSIAVLPLVNLTPAEQGDYLSDGLTEDLITALAKVPFLHVCARTSAWVYKGKAADVRDIGRALGVSSVLEGSVQQTGHRLRVTVQLIDARNGYHLWSEQYDRTLDDSFALEDDITRAIVGALTIRFAGQGLVAPRPRPAVNPDAYLLYLQGRYAWHERSAESLQRAVRAFGQALAIDSTYAAAYAGLADAYAVLPIYESVPETTAYAQAIRAARHALALDSTLASPHAALGVAYQRLYDWDQALVEYRRALALNPNDATAHQWYGKCLAEHGALVEGEAEVRRALLLDPLSAVTGYNLGQILFWEHRYPEAERALRSALAVRPTFYQAHTILGLIAAADGRPRDAVAEFHQVVASERARVPDDLAFLAYGYAIAGQRDSAVTLIHAVVTDTGRAAVSAADVAIAYMALGRMDTAFLWFDRAVLTHDSDLEAFMQAPTLAGLTGDRRFAALRTAVHE
jgi:TolB-like protein/DNA-binding SARP family transcriptional activator/Flp pilus assembly protein TadD